MKKWMALLLAVLMVFALVACTNEEKPEEQTPNTNEEPQKPQENEPEKEEKSEEVNEITVIWASEPNTLDPIYSGQMYGDNIFELVFDRMVGYRESETGAPELMDWGVAERWETIDELTWRFYLHDDIYFQDGEHLTAEDVVYTFERTVDPVVAGAGNYQYAYPSLYLEEMTVIDDYTIEFKTSQPVVMFANWMKEFFIFPKHYYETNEFDKLSLNPMGSGPYKLTEYKLNDVLVLERDDHYWGETHRGYIDKITFRFTPEATTRVAELITGNADIVDKLNFSLQEQVESGGAKFVVLASGTRQILGFTQYNDPALLIREVRQAVNYAVDWDTIAQTLLNGFSEGERMRSFAPKQIQDPDIFAYPYDPEKAVELLTQAGYVDNDGDGIVESPDGQPLELDIATPAGRYVMDKEITQAVAQYMGDIGIKANVEIIEWNTFTVDLQAKQTSFDLFCIGMGPSFHMIGDATNLYHESSANYGGWVNDEYTELYDELGGCFDEARAAEIGHRLQEIVAEEAPWVFLYNPPLFYGVSERVEWQAMANGRVFLREAKVIGYDYE